MPAGYEDAKHDTQEHRVYSKTGAVKGSKMERYDLIPTEPLRQLARHYGKGMEKYAARNWEAGYDWSLSYAALQRHANAFWAGEDIDEETGTPHIIAAAWHCFALAHYLAHPKYKEFDDRPRYDGEQPGIREDSGGIAGGAGQLQKGGSGLLIGPFGNTTGSFVDRKA